jgi:DNA mismatch repair protein MutS2
MNINILEDNEFLNQLNFNHFIDFFTNKSSFPGLISKNIFDRFLNKDELSSYFDKTQFFIDEHNYDESNELFHKLQKFKDYDLFKIIDMVSKEAFLEPHEINTCVLCIEYFKDHKTFIKNSNISSNSFDEILLFYKKFLIKNFRSFVNVDGEVNYQNHPVLKQLFSQLLNLESKIRQSLNEYKVQPDISKLLQHDGNDILNDRFVLAFRSDSYNSQIGQIVSRSETGRTLYIEPFEIKELNNQRIDTLIELRTLLDQLIKIVTKEISQYHTDLLAIAQSMVLIDEFYLRSEFAKFYNLNIPTISEDFSIELKSAFHPLISNPIKNDISISPEDFSLVISGPNTGGKTAFIKTVFLCQTFFNLGLFVPAREAFLYPVKNIFYFGADQQDLDSGLSSFSAEVKNYNELLDSLENENLIIIDEIFNSTSSEEASALAIALFDYINKNSNSKVIVSTHHQTLKSLLHSKNGFISAHVGFDHESLMPTYKLHIGVPGGSQALDIFKGYNNLKRTADIYNEAIKFLDNKSIHYEKLLNQLSIKESKLEKTLQENRNINQELKNQKAASQGVLNLKIENELKKTKEKFEKIINQAYSVLDQSKQGKFSNKKKLIKEENKLKTSFNQFLPEKTPETISENRSLIQPKEFSEGEVYFCSFLNQDITLKEIKGKQAFVFKGSLRIKVPIETLFISSKAKNTPKVQVNVQKSSINSFEFDCRGMRLSEFQSMVESNLYALECGEVPFLNFIHGHGDGVLKKWIRKFVKDYKGIEIDLNESGNDGETRLVLTQE